MADADALLIRQLIVAALEGGDAHTDLGKPFGTRSMISFATWLKRGRWESLAAFRPRRTLLPHPKEVAAAGRVLLGAWESRASLLENAMRTRESDRVACLRTAFAARAPRAWPMPPPVGLVGVRA